MRYILIILLLSLAANANAAQATLVSCTAGQSMTGRFVYIGTYSYYGHMFQQQFDSWCPFMIEVR